jgi:hypothetical protein
MPNRARAGVVAGADVPRARTRAMPAAGLACALALLAGCGGTRQDAHEPEKTFRMAVAHASFPAHQSIAQHALMLIAVRNTGLQTVPNVAVTVDSFNYASTYPELAANKRPIWVIEQGPGKRANPPVESQEVIQPGSGQTAYVNTWALGPLAPGQTRLFRWRVAAVKPGLHVVHYSVAAGLAGRSQARATRGLLQGHFVVNVAGVPPHTYVDPNTGKVVTGTAPPPPPGTES